MNTIDSTMNGLSFKKTLRSEISLAALHLSLAHYGAIIILIENNMNASANALLRPQYEALMRGLYFNEFATDKEIEDFSKGKNPKKLSEIVRAIDFNNTENKTMTRFYDTLKNRMNDYTHGGIGQIKQRYNTNELTENFSEMQKIQLLTLAKNLANIAACCAAIWLDREDLCNNFINKEYL